MELATPPPAVRTPAAWHAWWLLPLGLAAGTVTTVVAGPDGARIPGLVAGVVATAAAAFCVRLLLRSRAELRRAAAGFQTTQAHQLHQWQQRAAAQDQQWQERLATLEGTLEAERSAHEARIAEAARGGQDVAERQRVLTARLSGDYLPKALERLRAGDAIDDVLAPLGEDADAAATPEFRAELRKVLRAALISVEQELDRSTSAEQAVISIGSRIHVLTSKIRGRLHEMQGEHGRLPAVARGLMELDQAIGPADCLAASIGVLGGSDRPGRQWQEPQRLLSVVRGGIGRIKDFDRVQVRHLPELGVDGGLVDHLTLVFAQLLDNAARYSPPSEPVVVSGKEVPNGVGIEIQDAGKGLTEEKKRQAEQALQGIAEGPGLGGLSEDAHLGLRVVGALAQKYGIRVTFADSPWLGTSVVVVVPHKYFTPLPVLRPSGASQVLDDDLSVSAASLTAPDVLPADWRTDRTDITADDLSVDALAHHTEPHTQPFPGTRTFTETNAGTDTTPGGLPRRRSKRDTYEAADADQQPAPVTAATAATTTATVAVPPDASFTGLAAFATAGRETDEPRNEESD
ncbi:sensor histidine kinase [Streptomyces sp. NPDC058001]|uniref:sensor histidine kinase n=1 Tax=Streptomyces sp. NPDC058001 TaxID=3346300 RepID=UPI0036E261C5